MALRLATGFEIGTTAGWATGNAGNKFVDAVTGTPTIESSAPVRSGTYALELAPAGGTESVKWDTNTLATSQTRALIHFYLRFVTSLPSGSSPDLVQMVPAAAADDVYLFFNDADNTLRLGWGTGGTGATGPVIAADTWYRIELSWQVNASTHTVDWWVDGTAQSQASKADAASTVASVAFGNTGSDTFTARLDDLLIWTDTAAITTPAGAHKVTLLTVDTGGTWVLTGTAANWSTFTANGTLDSTFTVTEARDRCDEWPPTIGASADGVVQDAIAASDFLSSPMTSYTLGAGEAVAGLRALVAGWATSTTATNIRFDAYNGTTAETFFALGDPNFDNSTTAPAWVCKMLTTANYDTQGELDAIELQGGWGTDANPDCGWHGWAIELAIKESTGNATVNPAAIALVASLPAAGVSVGVAPAVLAGTAALPQAGVGVGAAPATLAAVASLPRAGVGVGAAPAPLAATSTLPLATAGQLGDATVNPATLAAVAALPAAVVSVGVAPAVLAAVASLPRAGVGVGVAPAAHAMPLTVSGGVGIDVGATPATLAAVASFPQATPDVGGGSATVNPATLAAVLAMPQAGVGVGAAPAVLAALLTLPQAGVGVGAAPATLAATLATPQAVVSVGVAPATVAAVVAMAQANVAVGVTPATLAALAAFPQATPDTGGTNASVSPATIVATTSFPQELVAVGVAPSPVMLVLSLPQPGVGVGVLPAVLAATATLPLSTIAVHGVPQPATIAAVASFPKANVAVGIAPATIALVVVVLAPETVGELALNINPPGPRMVGAVVIQTAAIVGAATRAGGMPGEIS